MNILVTGGAGFIGSHLDDALIVRGHHITVVDNLVLGRKENIAHLMENPNFKFVSLQDNVFYLFPKESYQ